MVENLNSLIEKINREGVEAAEGKARDIEAEAKRQAEEILEKAKKDAGRIIAEAKGEIARTEKSAEESVRQAGRNLIISLRKEIASILDSLITLRVREELNPAAMARIITSLIKNYKGPHEGNIIVSLSKEDLLKLEETFLSKLKSEAKKGITLKQSDEIRGGFVISYDSGKSHFDFTDKALAEYISSYLRPKLGELIKSAGSGKDKKI